MTSGHDLSVTVNLPAARATVWDHLTRPDLLLTWWPDDHAETDPRPGGRYAFSWAQGVTLRGEYLDVAPPDRLEWTWSWDHEDETPRRVTITLEDRGDSTDLIVAHEAHDDEERRSYEEGWAFFLGRLAAVLGSD